MPPMEKLSAGAKRLGIELSALQRAQFQAYRLELLSWNKRMNLTAITDPDEVETKHFLDSLTVALALSGLPRIAEGAPPLRVLDVGSGGGFPGLPLKIAFPELAIVLLEATQKKASFLRYVTEALSLFDVVTISERAEDLAHGPHQREAYDVVVARALAPLAELAELTLPLCRVGGMVVAQKKGDITAELALGQRSIEKLGGEASETITVSLPDLAEERKLVVLKKVSATPSEYPRRSGLPHKSPLGVPVKRSGVH